MKVYIELRQMETYERMLKAKVAHGMRGREGERGQEQFRY